MNKIKFERNTKQESQPNKSTRIVLTYAKRGKKPVVAAVSLPSRLFCDKLHLFMQKSRSVIGN